MTNPTTDVGSAQTGAVTFLKTFVSKVFELGNDANLSNDDIVILMKKILPTRRLLQDFEAPLKTGVTIASKITIPADIYSKVS